MLFTNILDTHFLKDFGLMATALILISIFLPLAITLQVFRKKIGLKGLKSAFKLKPDICEQKGEDNIGIITQQARFAAHKPG